MTKRMPWRYWFASAAVTCLAVATVQAQTNDANARARSAGVTETPVGRSLGLQLTNTGEWRENIFTGHVLSATTGVGSILYAPSEGDDPVYRAAISAAAGGAVVDYFDARAATPTVAQMQAYDCVYTWVNSAYADNVLFGDNLAAYVDGGGNVVLGVFCTFTTGNFLSGLIMTAAYSPVVSPAGTNHFALDNYAGDGVPCLYNNVLALSCGFRDILVLQGAGIQDGSYAGDGEICHAYRPDGRVVYSNGSGAGVVGCVGDWPIAVANACHCLGAPSSLIDCVCNSQYDVGDRVTAIVDNPSNNSNIFAGDQGTVICGADGFPPLLVLWDDFNGGHDGNGYCHCPSNGGGEGGGPITLPDSSGWFVDCDEVQLTVPCPGDVDGNGVVNIVDFLAMLANWGLCP